MKRTVMIVICLLCLCKEVFGSGVRGEEQALDSRHVIIIINRRGDQERVWSRGNQFIENEIRKICFNKDEVLIEGDVLLRPQDYLSIVGSGFSKLDMNFKNLIHTKDQYSGLDFGHVWLENPSQAHISSFFDQLKSAGLRFYNRDFPALSLSEPLALHYLRNSQKQIKDTYIINITYGKPTSHYACQGMYDGAGEWEEYLKNQYDEVWNMQVIPNEIQALQGAVGFGRYKSGYTPGSVPLKNLKWAVRLNDHFQRNYSRVKSYQNSVSLGGELLHISLHKWSNVNLENLKQPDGLQELGITQISNQCGEYEGTSTLNNTKTGIISIDQVHSDDERFDFLYHGNADTGGNIEFLTKLNNAASTYGTLYEIAPILEGSFSWDDSLYVTQVKRFRERMQFPIQLQVNENHLFYSNALFRWPYLGFCSLMSITVFVWGLIVGITLFVLFLINKRFNKRVNNAFNKSENVMRADSKFIRQFEFEYGSDDPIITAHDLKITVNEYVEMLNLGSLDAKWERIINNYLPNRFRKRLKNIRMDGVKIVSAAIPKGISINSIQWIAKDNFLNPKANYDLEFRPPSKGVRNELICKGDLYLNVQPDLMALTRDTIEHKFKLRIENTQKNSIREESIKSLIKINIKEHSDHVNLDRPVTATDFWISGTKVNLMKSFNDHELSYKKAVTEKWGEVQIVSHLPSLLKARVISLEMTDEDDGVLTFSEDGDKMSAKEILIDPAGASELVFPIYINKSRVKNGIDHRLTLKAHIHIPDSEQKLTLRIWETSAEVVQEATRKPRLHDFISSEIKYPDVPVIPELWEKSRTTGLDFQPLSGIRASSGASTIKEVSLVIGEQVPRVFKDDALPLVVKSTGEVALNPGLIMEAGVENIPDDLQDYLNFILDDEEYEVPVTLWKTLTDSDIEVEFIPRKSLQYLEKAAKKKNELMDIGTLVIKHENEYPFLIPLKEKLALSFHPTLSHSLDDSFDLKLNNAKRDHKKEISMMFSDFAFSKNYEVRISGEQIRKRKNINIDPPASRYQIEEIDCTKELKQVRLAEVDSDSVIAEHCWILQSNVQKIEFNDGLGRGLLRLSTDEDKKNLFFDPSKIGEITIPENEDLEFHYVIDDLEQSLELRLFRAIEPSEIDVDFKHMPHPIFAFDDFQYLDLKKDNPTIKIGEILVKYNGNHPFVFEYHRIPESHPSIAGIEIKAENPNLKALNHSNRERKFDVILDAEWFSSQTSFKLVFEDKKWEETFKIAKKGQPLKLIEAFKSTERKLDILALKRVDILPEAIRLVDENGKEISRWKPDKEPMNVDRDMCSLNYDAIEDIEEYEHIFLCFQLGGFSFRFPISVYETISNEDIDFDPPEGMIMKKLKEKGIRNMKERLFGEEDQIKKLGVLKLSLKKPMYPYLKAWKPDLRMNNALSVAKVGEMNKETTDLEIDVMLDFDKVNSKSPLQLWEKGDPDTKYIDYEDNY